MPPLDALFDLLLLLVVILVPLTAAAWFSETKLFKRLFGLSYSEDTQQ